MTMNTRVHIAKPVDAEGLFLHVLGILESDVSFVPNWSKPRNPGNPFIVSPGPLSLGKATYRHMHKGDPYLDKDGQPRLIGNPPRPFVSDESEYTTTLGQGLAAIWEVTYGSDGPLIWPSPEWGPMPTHCVSANFDTAYGYTAPNGANCGDLHAFLLREIGAWLTSVGVTEWVWYHEEAGTWHPPAEIWRHGNADRAAPSFAKR